MNAYFFKMNREEKENILDQHKHLYDGYLTNYNQQTNQTPLYVQDLANDKNGIYLDNKGNVKSYTNFRINESLYNDFSDSSYELKNGTVDFGDPSNLTQNEMDYLHDLYPSPNEEEEEYVSIGKKIDDDSEYSDDVIDFDYSQNLFNDVNGTENFPEDDYNDEFDVDREMIQNLDNDEVGYVMKDINESLDMFHRFKNYN